MSTPDRDPQPIECATTLTARPVVIEPRAVPLGGLRALPVRRTLPTREVSLIGAWCFVDHFGPTTTNSMTVAPHPHTGLQTVTWLFSGEVVHRDSLGNHLTVRPGELNVMTAGRGISHSEVSATQGSQASPLHGAQLWVALPDSERRGAPGLTHFAPEPLAGPGWQARVFLGDLLGSRSSVATATELVGAEITLAPEGRMTLPVRRDFEYGVLTDVGDLRVGTNRVSAGSLAAQGHGAERIDLEAGPWGARCLVIGGRPLDDEIVMWWNFVGRDHEEIEGFRSEWQAQITDSDGTAVSDAAQIRQGRFGVVAGDNLAPVPAPPMPNAVLKPRRGNPW